MRVLEGNDINSLVVRVRWDWEKRFLLCMILVLLFWLLFKRKMQFGYCKNFAFVIVSSSNFQPPEKSYTWPETVSSRGKSFWGCKEHNRVVCLCTMYICKRLTYFYEMRSHHTQEDTLQDTDISHCIFILILELLHKKR